MWCVTVKCVRVAHRGRCSALSCLQCGDGGSSVLSTCGRKTDILLKTVLPVSKGCNTKTTRPWCYAEFVAAGTAARCFSLNVSRVVL